MLRDYLLQIFELCDQAKEQIESWGEDWSGEEAIECIKKQIQELSDKESGNVSFISEKVFPLYIFLDSPLANAQQYIFKSEKERDYFLKEMSIHKKDLKILIPKNNFGLELLTWNVEDVFSLVEDFKDSEKFRQNINIILKGSENV